MIQVDSDAALRQNVLEELEWRPEINAAHIGVTAENGVVTLSGHVSTYAEKRAAEEAAQRVAGVRGVAADIEVRTSGGDATQDDEIAQRVLTLLAWDNSVPRGNVAVSVAGGWVTLIGEVPWQFQRTAAENAVRNLHGVLGVRNRIVLSPQLQPTDVRQRIESALKRSAELASQEIRVRVSGGAVTLEGTVDSWAARTHAETAAWAAPGVTEVRNELLVLVLRTSY
jgi:osmotically-inducible protein OsmY